MKRKTWHRIWNDLKNRRNVDAYSIGSVTFLLAILALIPDFVPDPLRWAVLLAGVGTLVLRITIPESQSDTMDELLNDRFAFDKTSFSERIKDAAEIWIFAPTAINILSVHNCDLLRCNILAKPDGILRVAVLDPSDSVAVELGVRQLDDSLDYPIQDFRDSLQATERQLHAMASWQVKGSVAYRFLDYNPGFSLVAIDPNSRNGRIIVEFHGFRNEATSSRMHIEISRQQSERWYKYWTDQFSGIWEAASDPRDTGLSSTPQPGQP